MSLFHLIAPSLRVSALSILLKSIVEQFLFDSYCLTLVSDAPIDLNLNFTFVYIIPNKTADSLKDQLLEVSEIGCSDYIVNMNYMIFLAAFDMVSRAGNNRRSDRKLVFLPPPENLIQYDYSHLFSMKETNYIANILMIVPDKTEKVDCEVYDLITHKFVGTDDEVNQPMFLTQWNSCIEKFNNSIHLFPHDINNLKGKTLKIASFTYKPYVFLNLDTSIAPEGRDGVELRIVEEFCKWVNCTIQIISEENDQWGEVFENGTGIGVIGRVVQDQADMGVAALYSWYEEYINLDFSAAGIRAAVTCVAPSPRLLATWALPLMPFTLYMWYGILITFFIASAGFVIAKRSIDGVFMTVFGLMISQSQKNANSGWRVRSVSGWLLVASLVLVSAYGGGLASSFTVAKYEPSIDTIQDMVDRNMEWGATHDAWIFSLTLSSDPLIKRLVSQFRIYSAEELKRKSFMRNLAFSIEKLPAGYFAIGDYLTKEALEDLTLMLEDFYYDHCVVILRKSSPYTEKISQLIGRLHQSGLLLTWETQVALKYLNFKVQQEVRLSRVQKDVGFKPLDLRRIVGIYIIYAVGVVVSILLFIIERLMRNNIKSEI